MVLSLLLFAALAAQQSAQGVMQIPFPVTVVLPNVNTVNTQSGTAYTLQPGDNNGLLVFTSASPVTLTVPAGLGAGFSVSIVQAGAGVVKPVGSGANIVQRLKLTETAGPSAVVLLIAYAADNFTLTGDLQ